MHTYMKVKDQNPVYFSLYILCCECVLLLLLNRHTAANTSAVSSMTALITAMIPPPTHGSGEQDTGVVLTGLAPK